MSDENTVGIYAHTDPEFPRDEEKWEPLFSEGCQALRGGVCEKCESLDRFHGHLNKVAWWTAKFAEEMFPAGSEEAKAAREWGYLAGLWHDLGKFAPEWQGYLREAAKGNAQRGPDHSTAGAILLTKELPKSSCSGHQLAAIAAILGHHAGIANRSGKENSIVRRIEKGDEKLGESLAGIPHELLELIRTKPCTSTPFDTILPLSDTESIPTKLSLLTRMLFSALVDSDSIVTGALESAEWRESLEHFRQVDEIQPLFDEKLDELCRRNVNGNKIAQHRQSILDDCRTAAESSPGFFTLNVPTGGGKTLSGMSFALNHAVKHKMRRVIVVIPYTSIIRQNAEEYRTYLGEEQVLEHHSNLDDFRNIAEGDEKALRHRLGCENWEAPIITTTTVQFYESLFANKRTRSRKVHNIAGSVIILDEAHLIPIPFMRVVLKALRGLVKDFHCSVVLCTATQPALHQRPKFPDGISNPTAIIPDERLRDLHRDFQDRTIIDWSRCHRRHSTTEIADEIAVQKTKAALAIVHLKRDALSLYRELKERVEDPESVFYLTTNLCPKHRADRLAEITRRIEAHRKDSENVAIYCVSTQLVECGCDLDFPFVYRALAGLDSIAQAAGRANRHGLHEIGEVRVYRAETDPFDPHLKRCLEVTDALLMHYGGELDISDPAVFESYFMKLFADSDLDVKGLVADLAELSFATIAKKFRVIESDSQVPVIVPYDENAKAQLREIERRVENEKSISKNLLRSLQPYTVNVFPGEFARLKDAVLPLMPESEAQVLNLALYPDAYSEEFGINAYEELGIPNTII